MPLKIGQVLYKRKDQSEEVNDAIEAYYDEYGHGNKYLAFYFEEEEDLQAVRTLANYFRGLGFTEDDELIICNEWWLDKVDDRAVFMNNLFFAEAKRIMEEHERPRHVKGW